MSDELNADVGPVEVAPAGDEPPKRTRTRKPRSSTSRSRKPRAATADKSPRAPRSRQPSLAKQIEPIFALAGLSMMAKCQPCGTHMLGQAEATSKAVADYARSRPGVERMLRRLVTVSDTGALITALGAFVLVPLAHHGVIPPAIGGMVGVVPAGADMPPPAEHVHDEADAA